MNSTTLRGIIICCLFVVMAGGTTRCTVLLADDAQSPSAQPATQPQTAPPSADVTALISQMSSDDFATRTSAQTKLVAMGEKILPQLRQVLLGELPDETRARVNASIAQIQDNVLLGPAVFTMHYKDAPLQTVLEDFAAQAGADLGIHRPRIVEYAKTRTATIDLDGANFWQALRALEDTSGMQTQPYSNLRGMVLDINPGIFPDFDMFSDASCTSGPVRIFAQSCSDNRTIQYGRGTAGRKQSVFTLMLVAVPEPKLRVAGQLNSDWLTECVDEHGHSLVADGPQQVYASNGSQWWWQLQANLKEHAGMGNEIATLRGTLKFTVECKIETVESDISQLHDLTRNFGPHTVTIHQLKRVQQGQYQLQFSVNGPGLNGRNMWQTVSTIVASIQIQDKAGQSYQQMGIGPQMQPGGKTMEVNVNYLSAQMMNGPAIGPAAIIKWDVPSETRQVTVPFVLHHLELPTAP